MEKGKDLLEVFLLPDQNRNLEKIIQQPRRYDGWIMTTWCLITICNQSRLMRSSLDTLTIDVKRAYYSSENNVTDGRPLWPKKKGKYSDAVYSFSGWFAPYWIMKVAAEDFCLLQSIRRRRCHHTRWWSQTGAWQMAHHLRQHDVLHAYV